MIARTLADASDLSSVMMIAGGIIAVLVLVFAVGSRRRRSGTVTVLDAHEKLERIEQGAAVKNELRETMRELEELARSLNDQLDEKTRRLEKLLAEADKRIVALQKAGPAAASPTRAPGPEDMGLDPISIKIYELTDAGRKPMEIARQLNEQVGKVELILALRQQVR